MKHPLTLLGTFILKATGYMTALDAAHKAIALAESRHREHVLALLTRVELLENVVGDPTERVMRPARRFPERAPRCTPFQDAAIRAAYTDPYVREKVIGILHRKGYVVPTENVKDAA